MSDGWTHYAPLDGPPRDTRCSFCGTALADIGGRGWMIGLEDAAICPRCIGVAARGLERLGDDFQEGPPTGL